MMLCKTKVAHITHIQHFIVIIDSNSLLLGDYCLSPRQYSQTI